MLRHLLTLAGSLLLLLGGSGCTKSGDGGDDFVTTLAITDDHDQPITSAPSSSTVRIHVTVRNISGENRSLVHGDSAIYDVRVSAADGTVVFDPDAAAAVVTTLDFTPGQAHTSIFDWDQRSSDAANALVPAGAYRVRAYVRGEPGDPGLTSPVVDLVIMPAAGG